MELTKNQKRAVESIDVSTAIIAGAGGGKTEVLTQRLIYILNSGKINLNQILCVTFTEKAAHELKKRVAQYLPEESKKDLPWAAIGTFHSFCLNLLREQAPLLGFSGAIEVWDEHTARLAIHKHCRKTLLEALDNKEPEAVLLLDEFEFRETLLLLEELMQFRWHVENYVSTKGREIEATIYLYKKILASYTAEKKTREVMDFQDLEMEALNLLKTNKEVLKQYQSRFKHILVDEVQDINDLQKNLIEILFNPKENRLCMVGDPKQSIYRFRGANVAGLQSLSDKILKAGGHRIELQENFRSRPAILNWINTLFENIFPADLFIPLIPTREKTTEANIYLISIDGNKKISSENRRKIEAEKIVEYIQHLVHSGKNSYGDITLLFQALSDIRHYEKALRAAQIPYRLSGGRGFLNAQEVIDLLFCLKLLVEPEDRLSLVGLMRSPLLGFSDIEITELCLKHPTDLEKALLQRPEAAWFKNISEKKKIMGSADILENVVQETHYDILVHELDPSGTKRANIEQLIELVRELEQEEELPLPDLVEYFEELKKRRSTLSPSSGIDLSVDACQLMTVHSAKGLQFPVLILPDLIRTPPPNTHPFLFVRNKGLGFSLKEEENTYLDTLKKEEKEADLEERKRLLYVALTRAEEKIVIPWHEEASRTGPWYAWLKEGISKKEYIETWSSSEKHENFSQPLQNKLRGDYFTLKKFKREEIRRPLTYFTVTELEKNVMKKTWEKVHEITSQNESTRLVGPTLGNVVHAVLKNIHNKKETLPQTLLSKVLFEQGVIATEKEISTTLAMIESFLKGEIAPPRFDGHHELPFSLKLPRATIVGTIDYALETDQGWILYDFKTDAQVSEQSEREGEAPPALPVEGATRAPVIDTEKYKLQMDVYALALSKGITKPVLATELLYIRHNKKVSTACTPERLQQTQEKLIEFVEKMGS